MKFESNGITHGKLIEAYIHSIRAAKNTRILALHGIHNYVAWAEKANKRWLLVHIIEKNSTLLFESAY